MNLSHVIRYIIRHRAKNWAKSSLGLRSYETADDRLQSQQVIRWLSPMSLCRGLRNRSFLMRSPHRSQREHNCSRRIIHARPLPVPINETTIRESSFRFIRGVSGPKELADWQSRDKTTTIYDAIPHTVAIYEIECPPTSSAVRLSIDRISHKGRFCYFYPVFLSLLDYYVCSLLPIISFERVCQNFYYFFL